MAAELLRQSPEKADNISREGFPEWKAFTLSEGDKESQWTAFSAIESGSDKEESSSQWIAQQVAKEALRWTQPVTPQAGDL